MNANVAANATMCNQAAVSMFTTTYFSGDNINFVFTACSSTIKWAAYQSAQFDMSVFSSQLVSAPPKWETSGVH